MNIWTLNHPWLDADQNLRAYGLMVYGTFNAFNTSRHAKLSDGEQAKMCIIQHCKQGALGHQPSMAFLDQRWKAPVSHIC